MVYASPARAPPVPPTAAEAIAMQTLHGGRGDDTRGGNSSSGGGTHANDEAATNRAKLGRDGHSERARSMSLLGRDTDSAQRNVHDVPRLPMVVGAWRDRAMSALARLTEPTQRQAVAFFLFGLLNNALYVVILTAALELIPKGTPTGVVAFFNIFPALVAKAVWPYVLKGRVRYARRIVSCVAMNAAGIVIIALFSALSMRLAGIALASFSSGLGELTFLQLSTRYGRRGAGRGVGWFSSGTGAAGLVGASAWWIVRPLGVRGGLLSLIFMPFIMAVAYGIVLPSVEAVAGDEADAKGSYAPLLADDGRGARMSGDTDGEDEDESDHGDRRQSSTSSRTAAVTGPTAVPLAISPHASGVEGIDENDVPKSEGQARVRLSLADKMKLIRPMLLVYIIPLVLVYFFEYTINQGVAPTLLYPIPTRTEHPLLSRIIKQLKDYYPLYQLTYQTFVFISRSSISLFGLPAIPKQYLWLPATVQGLLLALLMSESVYHWFRESIARPLAIVLVCVEGLAGGSAYVSVFYQISTDKEDHEPVSTTEDEEHRQYASGRNGIGHSASEALNTAEHEARRVQEHEFRIGCVGVGDAMGILVASLVAMPLELSLCDAQVRHGIDLCKHV